MLRIKSITAILVLILSFAWITDVSADSAKFTVMSGKSDSNVCYWSGQVKVRVVYNLTSKGTGMLYLHVTDRSNSNNTHFSKGLPVARGSGSEEFTFNAGGCLRGKMTAFLR